MTNFESYLRNIGKSEKTARNYAGAIRGPISNWALDNQLTKQSLVEFVDVLKFESVAASIRKLDIYACLLYTSPSPRDKRQSRMPSSA